MASSFKRTGPGTKVLLKRLKKPGTVDAGIIDAGQHADSDETVATIGFRHEFGVGVPKRSFIRSTTHEKRQAIVNLQAKLLREVLIGKMSREKALGLMGSFVAGEIKRKIVAIRTPPNSPETILRKGSSNPLIDTGQLLNSITHEVNR